MSDKYNPDHRQTRKTPSLPLTRLGGNAKPAHAAIYLLADHLDAVLAACEDIVTAHLTWNRGRRAGDAELTSDSTALRDAIEHIRKLENLVIMRVLKSRERAEETARVDKRFRQLAKLYVAGTAVLVDAVAECSDSTDSDFATADSVTAYMRSRGLVDPEAPAPSIGEDVQIGEDFLIAKRIAAGPLMDLSATLLDALELHYDLFLDDNELALPPQVNRFEDAPDTETDTGTDPLMDAISQVREDAAAAHADDNPEIWTRLGAAAVAKDVLDPLDDQTETAETTTTEADPWARELGLDGTTAETEPQSNDAAAEDPDDNSETGDAEPFAAMSDSEVAKRDHDGVEADAPGDQIGADSERVEAEADTPVTEDVADVEASDADTDTENADTGDRPSSDTDPTDIFDADTEIVMLSARGKAKPSATNADTDGDLDGAPDETARSNATDTVSSDPDDAATMDAGESTADAPEDDDVPALIITAANDDDDAQTSDDNAPHEHEDGVSTANEGEADHELAAPPEAGSDDVQDSAESVPDSNPQADATDATADASATKSDDGKKPPVKSLLSRLRGLKS